MSTPWDEHLARQRAQALANLRWHWAGAYEFGWTDGQYWAKRADDGETLTARAAADLGELVFINYSERRVPREPGRPAD